MQADGILYSGRLPGLLVQEREGCQLVTSLKGSPGRSLLLPLLFSFSGGAEHLLHT